MPDKLYSFIREYMMFISTKSLLCYSVEYVPLTGRCFTVFYKMKTNVTWVYSAFAFRKCWGCTRIHCWIYFRLQTRKWKTTAANSSQKGHLFFGHGRIHWQGLLPTGHEEGRFESQSGGQLQWIVLQGVPPMTMVDYYNDSKLHQSSPSGSVFRVG